MKAADIMIKEVLMIHSSAKVSQAIILNEVNRQKDSVY